MTIAVDTAVHICGLTIEDGVAAEGAAILNQASFTLEDVVLRGNTALQPGQRPLLDDGGLLRWRPGRRSARLLSM